MVNDILRLRNFMQYNEEDVKNAVAGDARKTFIVEMSDKGLGIRLSDARPPRQVGRNYQTEF